MKRFLFYARILLLSAPLGLMWTVYLANRVQADQVNPPSVAGVGFTSVEEAQPNPLSNQQILGLFKFYHNRIKTLEAEIQKRSIIESTFNSIAGAELLLICAFGIVVLQIIEFGYDRKREKGVTMVQVTE